MNSSLWSRSPGFVLLTLALSVSGCTELNNPRPYDPYSTQSPYGTQSAQNYDPYYYPPSRPAWDDGYRDRYRRDEIRRERRDIERERDRLDAERDALERERREEERRRLEEERREQYQPQRPVREVCPPGFSPSEQKCSPDERRRGCKDIRLPGGLGCVRR